MIRFMDNTLNTDRALGLARRFLIAAPLGRLADGSVVVRCGLCGVWCDLKPTRKGGFFINCKSCFSRTFICGRITRDLIQRAITAGAAALPLVRRRGPQHSAIAAAG